MEPLVEQMLHLYPRIFLACHARHVRDPKTRKVLSAHQASILDHLDEVTPTSLMDLAKHMGVTPGTMSLSVERLVRDGYVIRRRDTADKRRLHLRLTAAGARIRDAQTVLDPRLVRAMLAHLSPEERLRGIRGLGLLARAAQREMHCRAVKGRSRQRPHRANSAQAGEGGLG